MDFMQIALARQSTRAYDPARTVEQEKIENILEAARLAPSACNGQPYHFTVCRGKAAEAVLKSVTEMGRNTFAKDVSVFIVISEEEYCQRAADGAKQKNNDYRSMDIGIAVAYLTAQAQTEGLSTCILGWFDDMEMRELCHLTHPVRLIVALGYEKEGDPLRKKVRKSIEELVTYTNG